MPSQYVWNSCYFSVTRPNQHNLINVTDHCNILQKEKSNKDPCELNYDTSLGSSYPPEVGQWDYVAGLVS